MSCAKRRSVSSRSGFVGTGTLLECGEGRQGRPEHAADQPTDEHTSNGSRDSEEEKRNSRFHGAGEDAAEVRFLVDPNPVTARKLFRARAAERLTSLEADQEIAERFGLEP